MLICRYSRPGNNNLLGQDGAKNRKAFWDIELPVAGYGGIEHSGKRTALRIFINSELIVGDGNWGILCPE